MADIHSFRKAFKGDVVAEFDPDYEKAIERWALNAVRRAKVVAFVRDGEDVALALHYAKAAGLRIAVRGGGHSATGASSSEGGLIIDLSRHLNGARIDPEKRLAYVQGGAIWETVDNAAIKHKLATVGGTVNHTGVGGLVTGGGYGWLSGEHGLAIDNLVEATIVTADGSVRIANDHKNSDLFYGICGGGSNFGVVLQFVLQLHSQDETVFAGPLLFTRDQVERVAHAVDQWFPVASVKEAMQTVMTRGPDHKPYLIAMIFYNGTAAEGHEKFKAFYDISPVLDGARDLPYEQLNTLINEQAEPGRLAWMRGMLRDNPLKSLTLEIFDRVTQISETGEYEAFMITEFVPHQKINSVPVEKTPYRRNLPGNACAILHWTTDTLEIVEEAKRLTNELAGMIKTSGMSYGNYCPDNEALATARTAPINTAKELFRENYSRMQQIKRKYDPEMVFDKWFVITPV